MFQSLFCVRQRINQQQQSLELVYFITSGKSVIFPSVRHWRAFSRGRAAEKNIFSRVLRFNSHDNTAKINIIIIYHNKNKRACTKKLLLLIGASLEYFKRCCFKYAPCSKFSWINIFSNELDLIELKNLYLN